MVYAENPPVCPEQPGSLLAEDTHDRAACPHYARLPTTWPLPEWLAALRGLNDHVYVVITRLAWCRCHVKHVMTT